MRWKDFLMIVGLFLIIAALAFCVKLALLEIVLG